MVLLACAATAVATAQQPLPLPSSPPPLAQPPTGAGPLTQEQARVLDAIPDCAELTDDCQICRRLPAGVLACSTPGVACQRTQWRCSARGWPRN